MSAPAAAKRVGQQVGHRQHGRARCRTGTRPLEHAGAAAGHGRPARRRRRRGPRPRGGPPPTAAEAGADDHDPAGQRRSPRPPPATEWRLTPGARRRRRQVDERSAGRFGDRRGLDRRQGVVGEAVDAPLELVERAGVDEHLLDRADLVVGRGRARRPRRARRRAGRGPARWRCASSGVGLPSRRSSPTGLPVTAVVAEHAEHVVAQLERVAERERRSRQRPARSSPDAGRRARRRGAADARPCTCRTCSGRCARPSPGRGRRRAVPSTSRYWPTLSSIRSSFHTATPPAARRPAAGRRSTKARSPTRMATPSPKRRASPRQPLASWRSANARCVVRRAAPAWRSRPSRRRGTARRRAAARTRRRRRRPRVVGRVAAGADEAPVAERRAQALAAGEQQRRHRVERGGEVGVEVGPSRRSTSSSTRSLVPGR